MSNDYKRTIAYKGEHHIRQILDLPKTLRGTNTLAYFGLPSVTKKQVVRHIFSTNSVYGCVIKCFLASLMIMKMSELVQVDHPLPKTLRGTNALAYLDLP
jgi:hypothetical protein